ncbi:hypothetical protein PIB30_073857 [Stylosanthes scabra]|uniref:Uncharacterized protein n=1 Tax=Stylosanthes scabra TaxID=79078 RepID=A0ABU6ZN76_9FABA|nr:hypothetical protein [Stylosanthes scabra]
MAEGVLSFPFIATNEWQFRNFAVRFVRTGRTFIVGVHFRVLNILVIISMFSFSICVIPNGTKPLERTFAHSFRLHRVVVPRLESRHLRFDSTLQRFRIDSAQDLATMSHRKTPAVKLKSVPRKDPPQLSQLPWRKWFPIKEVWEDYQNFYSKMLILPQRFLNEGLLLEDKYPEFWELLDFQGLRPLLFTRERYYPCMMAAVAATLRIHDGLYDEEGDGEFQLMFWLAGFGMQL